MRETPERIYIPEHNKPCDCNAFLAFYLSRTQQTLLLQCLSCFLWSQNTTHLIITTLSCFFCSRTRTPLFVQCFPVYFWIQNTTNIIFAQKTNNHTFPILSFFIISGAPVRPPAPLHHRPSLWTLPESIKNRKALNE